MQTLEGKQWRIWVIGGKKISTLYETRSRVMSIKSRSLNSAIRPQSCSRGVLYVIIEFGVFKFFNTFIILEYNSVDNLC